MPESKKESAEILQTLLISMKLNFSAGRFYMFLRFLRCSSHISSAMDMFVPGDPEAGGYADGGISAGNKADQHDKGKVLRRIAAEEVQGGHAEEGSHQGIHGAADGLVNGIISQGGIAVHSPVGMKVFADSVKDNDRFVHGVAQNGQDGCQERRIHFEMEEGKGTENH